MQKLVEQQLLLSSEEQTEAFASLLSARLAELALTRAICIYLQGDLGAGKTTLSRYFLRGFGYAGTVKSPTYTLVEPYELPTRNLYHFDLYRLSDPGELEYLGVDDYFAGAGNICLVEWPDRAASMLPAADLLVQLSYPTVGEEASAETRHETSIEASAVAAEHSRQLAISATAAPFIELVESLRAI